jgi:hypothetical protein
MKYAVDTDSVVKMFMPSFIKSGSGIIRIILFGGGGDARYTAWSVYVYFHSFAIKLKDVV